MLLQNQITTNEKLDAVRLFEEKRWGHFPQCPYCGSKSLSNRRKDLRFKCLRCKRSGSVTVNSALHDTRLPLSLWLKAFSITAHSGKVPPVQHLQKNLNISYKSAVRMQNKLETFIASGDNTHITPENIMETLLLNSMKQHHEAVPEEVAVHL